MTDEVVIIETQDNTKREHTLVIDHDDFKQLISLYEKATNKLNELYDSVEEEQSTQNTTPTPKFKVGDRVEFADIDGWCEVSDIFYSNKLIGYRVRNFTDHSVISFALENELIEVKND